MGLEGPFTRTRFLVFFAIYFDLKGTVLRNGNEEQVEWMTCL